MGPSGHKFKFIIKHINSEVDPIVLQFISKYFIISPMQHETEIKSVNLLVHPDYSQAYGGRPTTFGDLIRRRRWDSRTVGTAMDPGSILLYFSVFTANNVHSMPPIHSLSDQLRRIDSDRIRRYSEILGDRFFLFPADLLPLRKELNKKFRKKGFSYDPTSMRLTAYGEYFDACVLVWGTHIQDELRIPSTNFHRLQDLSLDNH